MDLIHFNEIIFHNGKYRIKKEVTAKIVTHRFLNSV